MISVGDKGHVITESGWGQGDINNNIAWGIAYGFAYAGRN